MTEAEEALFKLPYLLGITVIGAISSLSMNRCHFLEGPIIIKGQQERSNYYIYNVYI